MTGASGPSAAIATPLALFLAHALTLENDAAERYADLADSLAVHNNPEVAALFRDLGRYSRLHHAEIAEIAKTVGELPRLAPWEYSWYTTEPPETGAFEGADYLMTARDALLLALGNEQQGHDYYATAGARSTDPEVARLAAQFAAEESEHVRLIIEWLERFPASGDRHRDDLDPPNAQE